MAQFSVKIMRLTGSVLGENQHNGWYWVEYLSTTDGSKTAVPAGNGVATCTGCHSKGNDFVLSKLPE